jgi:arginine/ornithine N-succinyltransferase beta subunit
MNEIRKPDLNAPRFRKTSCNILNTQFIENLKLKFPQYEHLTSDEIKNIIIKMFGKLQLILEMV